jgi:LysR family transcriptional regulator, glycine cleavage system transcriptional activator
MISMSKQHKPTAARRLLPPIAALSAFEAVARRGSFTAAADELTLTQSAISRQVGALEALLGVALFEGNRRKQVVLTPSGLFYAERVGQLLSTLAAATSETIALGGRGRALRLGIPPTFGSRWLIPRIQGFFKGHPDIAVEFTTRVPGRPNPDLENIDALIDFAPTPGVNAEWHKLMELELRPVATPDLAARVLHAEAGDLTDIHVLVHVTERAALSAMLREPALALLRGQPMLTFESYAMLFQSAHAGLGIGIAPMEFIEHELTAGTLVPLAEQAIISGNVGYLVYQAAKSSYPPLEAFRTWLFKMVNSNRK